MNIYDKISQMADEPGTYDEKMYRVLSSDKYASGLTTLFFLDLF